MAREGLSKKILEQFEIPLPPLPEQHRIVAKIDRLMTRCDGLEKLRTEREDKRLAVHAAAIQQLLDSPEGSAWNFIRKHFGELYTVKENVAELRKAVLQLAVMGRLVPQDPNDPPAGELLKAIEAEKQRLVKADKIKKPKPLPPIKPEEVPYEPPKGWKWVRLGDLGYILGGGTPSKSKHHYWNGHIPWVSPKDMKVDYIYDCQDHISGEAVSGSSVRLIPEQALLLVVRGMILAHSFPTAITKTVVTVNQDMKALCPYFQDIQEFLLILTKGRRRDFLGLVERSTHGTCRLETYRLFSIVVGLPPLPEQHRIVAKIDRLMAICDTLERQIDAAKAKRTELLNAVTARV